MSEIKFIFSSVVLSYVNLIIRPVKEPRREERKICACRQACRQAQHYP